MSGDKVTVVLYHHSYGVDVGLYKSPDLAYETIAKLIKEGAEDFSEEPDEELLKLLDDNKIIEAMAYYQQMSNEYFDIVERMVVE